MYDADSVKIDIKYSIVPSLTFLSQTYWYNAVLCNVAWAFIHESLVPESDNSTRTRANGGQFLYYQKYRVGPILPLVRDHSQEWWLSEPGNRGRIGFSPFLFIVTQLLYNSVSC
jgi:hypothetical protein